MVHNYLRHQLCSKLAHPGKFPSTLSFIRLLRFASSISSKPSSNSSVSLLPPIVLYRRLLRIHRYLPIEMRTLGDSYVKDEFRRCRWIENPIHIIGFLSQWKSYCDDLHATQLDSSNKRETSQIGKKLPEDLLEKLSPEQVGQLFELLKATKEIWLDVDPDPQKN